VDDERVGDLLRDQDGVISRAQLLACGGAAHDVKRLVRRRVLSRLLPGVYVDHTGTPTWAQRAVAGVLYAGRLDPSLRPVDAALGGASAIRAALGAPWRGAPDAAPLTVLIDDRRSVTSQRGYRFVRAAGLASRADWLRTPPRLHPAEAGLDLALDAPDLLSAVGLVADACQTRCVTPDQIRDALAGRPRVSGRAAMTGMLGDLAEGTCSALEHLFLTRVLRPHGLPRPRQQTPRVVISSEGVRREYRDVEWEKWSLVVELDGRAFHDHATQRDLDLDRDLDDAVAGSLAIRLGWGQVTRRSCRTAHRLAVLLAARGWTGVAKACSDCRDA
jgi:hypothetical protein